MTTFRLGNAIATYPDAQLDIFGSQPPQFKGATFVPERDGPRLVKQLDKVRTLMLNHAGKWWTLKAISVCTDSPEASVSARLRDINREGRTEGYRIERRYVMRGLHEYMLVMQPTSPAPAAQS
jgi:hypothetical protein